ncbi:MAG: serine/threonine protein kinase [Deltaproteobacteria bacterium]|nr:serine/threonine protein kinase [Deltaproteobacteria bacterium]
MLLEAGTTIGPLRLVECVAHGGTSSVWSAHHAARGHDVAVKFLSPEVAEADPAWRQRIQREATIGARIGSAHVVQIYEEGQTPDGEPYIVMELLEGIDVARAVTTTGPLSLHETVAILRQVATVLGRAHDLGIVHRDIKPDNLFLVDAPTLTVKVLDFGIAKLTDGRTRASEQPAMTKTGAVIGTPEFMSPEQSVSARDVDHRADLFSLGMVAYFALTGDLPFPTGGAAPLWRRVETGPAPIRRRRDDLPPELEAWFRRALALQPEDRYPSAKEMIEVLGEIASPHIPDAPPTTRRFSLGDAAPFRPQRSPDHTPSTPAAVAARPTSVATRATASGPGDTRCGDADPEATNTAPSYEVPDFVRGSVTVGGSADEPILVARRGVVPAKPVEAPPRVDAAATPERTPSSVDESAVPPPTPTPPAVVATSALDSPAAKVPLGLWLALLAASLGAAASLFR